MDDQVGIYPQQPNSPLEITKSNLDHIGNYHLNGRSIIDREHFLGDPDVFNPIKADDIIALPYAVGRTFTSRPDDNLNRLTWPFLWQQTEYVLGGGSSHYMFLVLAAQQLLGGK